MRTPPSLLVRLRQPTEQGAWEDFVRLYTPLFYYWARRLGVRGPDADDLIQDVFVTLLRRLPAFTYDPGKSFRSWLRTLLLNKWRDDHRREPAEPTLRADLANLAGPDCRHDLEEADYRQFLVGRALHIMKAEFEPTTWKACWEYAVRGRPVAEVAAELGVSVAVVYSAKSRVLKRLRHELCGLLD